MNRRTLLGAAGLAVTAAGTGAFLNNANAGESGATPTVEADVSAMVDRSTPAGVRPAAGGHGQTLVFSDEFNGRKLNTNKWKASDQQRDSGNHGVDWWYKPDNVRVNDRGALALDISKLGPNTYAGARVHSKGKFDFRFGTIEFRMHIPPTIGHLAAAWMMPTNKTNVTNGNARDGAEIDIVETFSKSDKYAVTIHWDGYGDAHQQSSRQVAAPGLHDRWWHTFTLNWWPERMVFSYDGNRVRTVTDPKLISQVKEYPMASNEILDFAEGDIRNAPLDWTSSVLVDYIRVWR